MSELAKTNAGGKVFRDYLLTSVCGLASAMSFAGMAAAEDTSNPTVWIQLGGQLERMDDSNEALSPAFLQGFDSALFKSIQPVQSSLRYSNGAEGKISFQPVGMNVVVSASLRYGRSNGHRADYQRLPAISFPVTQIGAVAPVTFFEVPPKHLNAITDNTERHLIADFRAGKDVGLGMFGSGGSSLVSLGVRFAQFTAGTQTNINGVPDFAQAGHEFKYEGVFQSHHRYADTVDIERNFHGVGPSLSWDSAAAILAPGEGASVTADWGINGAVLFGRQKVRGTGQVTGQHYATFSKITKFGHTTRYNGVHSSYHRNQNIDRSHSVIVPNIGGFAGLSFRYTNAKVSLGYRADFFFGAMDGGIDSRKTYDRNFYGPFATISIGLGG